MATTPSLSGITSQPAAAASPVCWSFWLRMPAARSSAIPTLICEGEEAEEIFQFIAFWKKDHGKLPSHLVFDSKLTTYEGLARLDKMDIPFITLRRRSPKLLKEIVLLPRSAWRTVELDVPTRKYRTPRVFEQNIALAGCRMRQLFVHDIVH